MGMECNVGNITLINSNNTGVVGCSALKGVRAREVTEVGSIHECNGLSDVRISNNH